MKHQRIAIGVIENKHQKFLVSQRQMGTHLEGFWEFPGGKLNTQESFKMALRRELAEEVGIYVGGVNKLIEFQYQYEDIDLHFQVYKVSSFSGEVRSNENQKLKWVSNEELKALSLPPANQAILDALFLPHEYMIADQAVLGNDLFMHVKKNLLSGISICQYRAHNSKKDEYISIAKELRDLCKEHGARMICNCNLDWIDDISPHGIHLNSTRLVSERKNITEDSNGRFFSASCHTKVEVDLANQHNAKCILLGPVQQTQSHKGADYLGWNKFNNLCFCANVPVYALGGLNKKDQNVAMAHGAQGVAGIRMFVN